MPILEFEKTKTLLKKYNIPFCETEIFNSSVKALNFAKQIGFPVVLKIHSSKIFHKSEVKGVKLGINNEQEFVKAWNELVKIKDIEGILVQKTAEGVEMVIGMKKDDQFGPVLMFGLGGIFVEVLKDVAFRVGPLNTSEALAMIQEIKGFKLLQGYRNQKGVNINQLTKTLVQVSHLAEKEKDILAIDFNPVIGNPKSVLVVDFRIVV